MSESVECLRPGCDAEPFSVGLCLTCVRDDEYDPRYQGVEVDGHVTDGHGPPISEQAATAVTVQ